VGRLPVRTWPKIQLDSVEDRLAKIDFGRDIAAIKARHYDR
jgi:hypothetical protein